MNNSSPQQPGDGAAVDGTVVPLPSRAPRTPLLPAHTGESIGDDADPQQDVAPNLGGEEQMQDA